MARSSPSTTPPITRTRPKIAKCEEPFVDAHIYTPTEYVGSLMELCQNRRGVMRDMKYLDATRVDLHYELPLGEIVYDFFDAIKSRSRGYASYDYEMKGFVESKLVKLDILLNGDMVDALSMIVHADTAYAKGRRLAEKLKENIPRQMFEIPIQAAIGGKIIARETVKAMRKDVLAKCYGGDITRKKKLLEKQKEGKKKMRQLGTVSVPSRGVHRRAEAGRVTAPARMWKEMRGPKRPSRRVWQKGGGGLQQKQNKKPGRAARHVRAVRHVRGRGAVCPCAAPGHPAPARL